MIRKVIISIVVVLLLAGTYIGYSFFRTPQEASAPIEAMPLVIAEETQSEEAESLDSNADALMVDGDTSASETQADENASAVSTTDANAESVSATLTVYEIVQPESQARFYIDEVLRGDPVIVEGATDQVAGQIALNPQDLSTAHVGTILVNTRTLATDNDFRNRAIKNRILLTDDYEFVRFEPTEIIGLPESGTVGESYSFQIVGNLTITDSTQQVTFDATVTPTSDTRLEGVASTTILYADYGITIPASQSVDAVEDQLRLEINFVAETV